MAAHQLWATKPHRLQWDSPFLFQTFPPAFAIPHFVVQGHWWSFLVSWKIYVLFNALFPAEIQDHKGDCVCEHFHGGAMRRSLLLNQVFTFSFTVYWNQKAGKSLGDTPHHSLPRQFFFPGSRTQKLPDSTTILLWGRVQLWACSSSLLKTHFYMLPFCT